MLYLPAEDPIARITRLTRWHSWFAWHPVRAGGRWLWLRTVRRRLQAPCAFRPWRREAAHCAGDCQRGSPRAAGSARPLACCQLPAG